MKLGVVVPCRNEAAVIERRLANLAASRWPALPVGAVHEVVVVDDGSDDGTADVARAACERLFAADGVGQRDALGGTAVRARVVPNDGRPGKAGAIAAGLAVLGGDVGLVVLSDADVVAEPGALVALADAFAREPRLGMACGAQRFVRALASDGSCAGPDGAPPVDAGERYDRWTARVRALESRCGRLFSVHGQLLAWRTDLGLAPTPGVAADDLDLMLQARAAGRTIRRVSAARFLEIKTPAGPHARAQALRRARAYVQAIARPGVGLGPGPLDRAQWLFYRHVPLAAPWLAPLAAAALAALALATAARLAGGLGLALASALVLAAAFAPAGREAARLARVIAQAVREERAAPLGDRWEMERS